MEGWRHPIQVSTVHNPNGSVIVTALCNDGTLWLFDTRLSACWHPLPHIPQPKECPGE